MDNTTYKVSLKRREIEFLRELFGSNIGITLANVEHAASAKKAIFDIQLPPEPPK